MWRRHGQRCGPGRAPALVADQHGRLALGPEDRQRLLEARVEAGQPGQVGAVLAVGVDHQPVVAALLHPLAQPLQPRWVDRRGQLGHLLGHAELGQVDPLPAAPCGRRVPACGRRSFDQLRAGAARDQHGPVGRHGLPRTVLAVGPDDPHLGRSGVRPARSGPGRAGRWRDRRRRSPRGASSAPRCAPRSRHRSHPCCAPAGPAARRASCPSARSPRRCRCPRCDTALRCRPGRPPPGRAAHRG